MAPKKKDPEPEPEPEPESEPEPFDKVAAELTWRHMSKQEQDEYFKLAGDADAAGE